MIAGHKGVAKASFLTSTIGASYDYFFGDTEGKGATKGGGKETAGCKARERACVCLMRRRNEIDTRCGG